jgi:hypothetical protein
MTELPFQSVGCSSVSVPLSSNNAEQDTTPPNWKNLRKQSSMRLATGWRSSTYWGEEHKHSLADLKTALDHHYLRNAHHPEHYPNGVDGMSL